MTTANHDQFGSRCKAHIDQATRTALSRPPPSGAMPQCSFTRPDIRALVQHFRRVKVGRADKAAVSTNSLNPIFYL